MEANELAPNTLDELALYAIWNSEARVEMIDGGRHWCDSVCHGWN